MPGHVNYFELIAVESQGGAEMRAIVSHTVRGFVAPAE
jgi:hypothetical protein